MKRGYHLGAMYLETEGERIERVPVELGNSIIYPGKFVKKLGDINRTSFEMQDGWYLRYQGKVEEHIIFDTNCDSDSNIYYAFAYIDRNTLLICGNSGCRDIRINEVEIFDTVEMKHIDEQTSMFK